MPLLLEDLAEETSASNRRTAKRLNEEARHLEQLRLADDSLPERRKRAVESARQATDYAIARVPEAEAVWRLVLASLRTEPTGEHAERLLRGALGALESCQSLVPPTREMWGLAAQLGATPEGIDELDRAEQRFRELVAEAKLALEHRAGAWQPEDPERLALGLRLAREGKTVKSDEARARFRRTGG
jgi:hypothetical protein